MNSRPSQEIRNELIHAKLEREELGTPPLVIPQEALVQRLTTEALVAMPQDQPQARALQTLPCANSRTNGRPSANSTARSKHLRKN